MDIYYVQLWLVSFMIKLSDKIVANKMCCNIYCKYKVTVVFNVIYCIMWLHILYMHEPSKTVTQCKLTSTTVMYTIHCIVQLACTHITDIARTCTVHIIYMCKIILYTRSRPSVLVSSASENAQLSSWSAAPCPPPHLFFSFFFSLAHHSLTHSLTHSLVFCQTRYFAFLTCHLKP
jgi:hypothetical protein